MSRADYSGAISSFTVQNSSIRSRASSTRTSPCFATLSRIDSHLSHLRHVVQRTHQPPQVQLPLENASCGARAQRSMVGTRIEGDCRGQSYCPSEWTITVVILRKRKGTRHAGGYIARNCKEIYLRERVSDSTCTARLFLIP